MKKTGFRMSGHVPTLVASLVHFDVSFMVWVLLGALGAYISADLGLTPAQKGLMVAVPPLGGSVFRLILGSLADRVGTKRTGVLSMALVAIPLLWGWFAAGTYIEILGVGLLLGIAGASFAVALPLVSRWYPPEYQGLALGITGAGNSGTIVAALVAPRFAEHVGWHAVFGIALVPVTIAWLVFFFLAKEPPKRLQPSGGLLSLIGESDARWLCLFYVVTFGGFVGLAGYLPIFFVDRFGITKVAAAGFAALCAASGSLLRPFGGTLADRFGGTRILGIVLALIAAMGLALAALPSLAITVALLFCTLGALGIGNGAVFQLVPQRYPSRIGAMTGLVGAAGGVGGFLLPFEFGSLVSSTGTFATGFILFGCAAALAAGSVVWRQRVWRRDWELAVEVAV